MDKLNGPRETLLPARAVRFGRGNRPGHALRVLQVRRGPKPPARACPAPGGRWPVVGPGPAGLQGTVPRGRGKRGSRFLFPHGTGESTFTAAMAGAIAPATAPRCLLSSRGPKAPGQRPPRPRRALCTRRVGRWPFVVPGPAGLLGTVPQGRGKRVAFPPPALAKARSPLQWQGPSPLPQRHAAP